jgi:hypothetical protein
MTTNHELKPLNARQIAALTAALNPARVETLKKGSSSLSYLAAWDVKATLIKVFGFGGFSAEADECEVVRIENNVPKTTGWGENKQTLPIEFDPDGQIKFGTANFRVSVRVRVKLTIHQLGAVYTEWAACSQTGPDLGEVTDFAIKTAESDALKRAAIYLGTQFGLSLYASDKNHIHYADVVKVILADEQEFPALNPDQKAQRELQAQRELEYIAAIIDGIDPETAKANIWGTGLPDSRPVQQQAVTVPEGSAQTPEQYAESQALVQRALTMKAQQGQQEQGIDFAAMAAEEQGQAAVLTD